MKMEKIQTILFYFTMFLFFGGSFSASASEKIIYKDIGIIFDGDFVQVNIADVPLEKILQAFKEAKGIDYKGDEEVLTLKLTGNFEKLSVEEALHRILYNFDHSVIYNKNEEIIQVRVVDKGKGKNIQSIDKNEEDKKVEFFEANSASADNKIQGKWKPFKVIKDCPPPGGPITYAPGEKESFVPKYNVPPPGGLPDDSWMLKEDFKNIPPPPDSHMGETNQNKQQPQINKTTNNESQIPSSPKIKVEAP
jgi:hypothetical protein